MMRTAGGGGRIAQSCGVEPCVWSPVKPRRLANSRSLSEEPETALALTVHLGLGDGLNGSRIRQAQLRRRARDCTRGQANSRLSHR